MNITLQNIIREELCPDGIWQLTNVMKSVLKYQMSRLPKRTVSESETRYPTTRAGMRSFLDIFFTRHYFQTQHSLFDYMTSNEFLSLLTSGKLQILDVGSGPAVASLAITDMFACVLRGLREIGKFAKGKAVKVIYVLNDTSGICLGTGQRMLADYFRISREHSKGVIHSQTINTQKAFPGNMNQLRRIKLNLGTYDIAAFCYVVVPLNEDKGFNRLVDGLLSIEKLCNRKGRILILQDRFQASLIQQVGRAIGISTHKEELTQCVYSSRNANETHSYAYYRCLYAPTREMIVKANYMA